ncbi:hypothetical protein QJQ45_000610 [Haematococcus lacustris]|nr:hypothetical protein QJQ45_000610 [Haematococcus lacustris]
MVRGCFTRVTVLADGQELLEEIPAEDAVIPNLAERNLYLQLGRGTPPPGMHTQPSLAVVAVLAAHPGLRDELTAVPRYPHDSNTVDDVGQKLEPTASPGCLSAELGKRWLWLEPGSSLAHTSTSAALGCPWMAGQPGLSGVVVTKAWRQMGVNRGSLLRHAVDTSRQLEAAHVSWQADWADWQALGGQPNSRPYRPPSPFAITPGCSCKAHHIKLDTRAIYGLVRAAGMLPADITSLPKFRDGVAEPKDSEVAAPGAQHGDAVLHPGPDVLNKHQQHQVLRPGRVSRAEHPPHCSRAGSPSRAQQLAGPPRHA